MVDILSEIVEYKVQEVADAKKRLPEAELRAMALGVPESSRSMSRALASSDSGIIAEFKRKSPSKGWIHEDADPLDVVPMYAAGGASALSILTDSRYFGGCLDFIRKVRPLVDIPILRKDFIIDEYQLLEARLAGADAVLLIAACLPLEKCTELVGKAHELGLEVLLETHSESELEYLQCGADMIGVNNRNLGTFHVDVQNSFRMISGLLAGTGDSDASLRSATPQAVPPLTVPRVACSSSPVPASRPVLVSESGISSPGTVRELRTAGFRGFLMGENFMKHDNPGEVLRQFVSEL